MSRLIGSIGLIAGTAIGAGMLAMPVATAQMGFALSLMALTLVALIMVYIGFLMTESLARMPENSTLIAMAESTFGRWGRLLASLSYIFLLFALNSSYLGVATTLLAGVLELSAQALILVKLVLLAVLGLCVASRVEIIDKFNRLLVVGLIISYLLLLAVTMPTIEISLLSRFDSTGLLAPLSLISTAFGYHIILPNIFNYLNRDVKQVRLAIIFGSLVPLFVYALWQLVVLGNVPYEGASGLSVALDRGYSALEPLSSTLGLAQITLVGAAFSFFAIMTSFLGTFLGVVEFLSDAMGRGKSLRNHAFMTLVAAVPIFIFNLVEPRIFFVALSYAGIMVAILIGLLPIAMTWRSRSMHGALQADQDETTQGVGMGSCSYVTGGGKSMMLGVALFFISLILYEVGLLDALTGLFT